VNKEYCVEISQIKNNICIYFLNAYHLLHVLTIIHEAQLEGIEGGVDTFVDAYEGMV